MPDPSEVMTNEEKYINGAATLMQNLIDKMELVDPSQNKGRYSTNARYFATRATDHGLEVLDFSCGRVPGKDGDTVTLLFSVLTDVDAAEYQSIFEEEGIYSIAFMNSIKEALDIARGNKEGIGGRVDRSFYAFNGNLGEPQITGAVTEENADFLLGISLDSFNVHHNSKENIDTIR